MLGAVLALALCALQLCPGVFGGVRPQMLVERSGARRLSKVGGFAWENCGDGRDPVVLKSLSVAPDPISIPGSLRISAAASSSKTVASPLKAVLVVEKALGDLWIQLPCIDQLGSCTYNDVCVILDNLIPPGTTCPEPLLTYGIPCHCPFKAGSYSLPARSSPVSSWPSPCSPSEGQGILPPFPTTLVLSPVLSSCTPSSATPSQGVSSLLLSGGCRSPASA
ncbi:ganglioside GM2 activator isoform X1 [Calypte anna]|uniref:ganglioside GM2 activator isoform X1 n=1 Tax=Calypte anna TaxID=9244 RepID=UPI0011C36E49|nr:ganglioside GM2 activator isoform X1 [Calypte anna]